MSHEGGPRSARRVEVIADLLQVNALFRLRAAQGVLGLAGKHGPERLERACARAIEVGHPSYRTIKGILAARSETDPPPPATGDAGAAAHLHGPSQLFANVVALLTPSSHPRRTRTPRRRSPQQQPRRTRRSPPPSPHRARRPGRLKSEATESKEAS